MSWYKVNAGETPLAEHIIRESETDSGVTIEQVASWIAKVYDKPGKKADPANHRDSAKAELDRLHAAKRIKPAQADNTYKIHR